MQGDKSSQEAGPEPALTIRLFGGMAIHDQAGANCLPRSRKTRAVLAMLSLTAPRPTTRGQLTALLWSRRGTAQGRASLRQAVHEIQATFGTAWSCVLVAERHSLAMDLRGVTVDAREAADEGMPKTELLTLFEGGFLNDLVGLDPAFDTWLAKERRRIKAIARIGGEAFLVERHPGSVTIMAARSLLRLDPANDGAWRALIESHIETGDRAAARLACEQWGEAKGRSPADPPSEEVSGLLSLIRFGVNYRPPNPDRTQETQEGFGKSPPSAEGYAPSGNIREVTARSGPFGEPAKRNAAPNQKMNDAGMEISWPGRQRTVDASIFDGSHPADAIPDRIAPRLIMPDGSPTGWMMPADFLSVRTGSGDSRPHGMSEDVVVPGDGFPFSPTPNEWSQVTDTTGPNAEAGLPASRFPGTVRSGAAAKEIPAPEPVRKGRSRSEPLEGGSSETASQRRSALRLGIRQMRVIGNNVDPALSEGIAEELITTLSRFRWISCISGSSLAAMAGESDEFGLNWPELDLDLILDGTIQGGAERVRITVRLLDLRAGSAVIWANRFDYDAFDTLAVQDRVAAAVVAQMDPLLLIREGERAAKHNPNGVTARDLVLRAVPAIYRMDRLTFRSAGELLAAALRADPGHADALAWYAYWHLFLVGQGWSDDPEAAIRRAGELADTAVTMDPHDARALTLAGHVRGFLLKRPHEAAVLHERAISLNPNLALAWCFSGFTLSYMGEHATALVRMTRAIELSPSDPHLFFFHAAIVMPRLLLGNYEEAATAGRKAMELNPWFSSSFKGCLAALGHLGLKQEAASVMARLARLEPNFTVRDAIARSPMNVPADIERYADGLRRAGLPEW